MPNQRGKDLAFVGCHVSASLYKKICAAAGRGDLSPWLREAIAESLRRHGIIVVPDEVQPPPRRKKLFYQRNRDIAGDDPALNERGPR